MDPSSLGSRDLALFGSGLRAGVIETAGRSVPGTGVELSLGVWQKEDGKYGKPVKRLRAQGRSSTPDILKHLKELELKKGQINDEMDHLVRAFGLGEAGSKAIGCLRLEEVYNVKNGRRYGPYGPYYYVYLHRTAKLEKRYLGKSAEKFKVRRDAIEKLRQLEAEYRKILKLERRLIRDTLR